MNFNRLIDGYNVMYAGGLARMRSQNHDFASCRERFLKILSAGFSEVERAKTIVIFDGQTEITDRDIAEVQFGLTVQFAGRDEEADDLIRRLIQSHRAPEQLFVITSDRSLQTAARRRKAHYRTSTEFWRELRKEGSGG